MFCGHPVALSFYNGFYVFFQILIRPLIRQDQPGAPDEQQLLPEAQTCFNHFALPRYKKIEAMEEKLKIALNDFNKGFGLE